MARGVSLHQKVVGGVYHVNFRDPRENGRQRRPSTETSDGDEAERVALSLSRIIYNPEYWTSPPAEAKLHPTALKIWGAELVGDRIAQTMEKRIESKAASIRGYKRRVWDGEVAEQDAAKEIERLEREVADLRKKADEAHEVVAERDALRDEVRRLREMVRKMGGRGLLRTEPKEIGAAVTEYMGSPTGSNATGGFRKSVQWWLDALVEWADEKADIMSLEPEAVAEYLGALLKDSKDGKHKAVASGTVKQRMNQVCRFLRFATKGSFDEDSLKRTLLPLLNKIAEETEDEEWFWIVPSEVKKLVSKMAELHGEYWGDAASVQYGLGLRAEELPLLQTLNVKTENDRLMVRVDRITDAKGKVLRRLKTKRSRAWVEAHKDAIAAVNRRTAEGQYLLFPFQSPFQNPRALALLSPEERRLGLWPAADDGEFSEHYLRRLRSSAAAFGLEKAKVDCRLLRRSRARHLAEKQGLANAAVYIRDSLDVLRKHYADLDASDIRLSENLGPTTNVAPTA